MKINDNSSLLIALLYLFYFLAQAIAITDLIKAEKLHSKFSPSRAARNKDSKPNKLQKRTMSVEKGEKYDWAVALLRGSDGNAVASSVSFVLSLAVLFWAIFSVDMSKEQRLIATLTVFYLMSSTFTLSKTIRDWQMSKVLEMPLLAGSDAWFWQCIISFLVAFLACIYSALVVEAPEIEIELESFRISKEPIGFLIIGLSFALSSTLSLAKLVRDRQDAAYFEEETTVDYGYKHIAQLITEGNSIYGNAIWALFIFDIAAFLYSIQRFHLSNERMDLLVLGAAFIIYACFLLAKAVRDNESKHEVLHPTTMHWFMYAVAPVIAFGFTMEGLMEIPFSVEQKSFMTIIIVCIMSITFSLAKAIRDRQEVSWL